mmetsp:Transcript_9967/g.21896  ORF Transcript_9967/g.21896 Transcript_9967/m.21896 type:complete len:206 (+) Transcript_9967:145-762(+)
MGLARPVGRPLFLPGQRKPLLEPRACWQAQLRLGEPVDAGAQKLVELRLHLLMDSPVTPALQIELHALAQRDRNLLVFLLDVLRQGGPPLGFGGPLPTAHHAKATQGLRELHHRHNLPRRDVLREPLVELQNLHLLEDGHAAVLPAPATHSGSQGVRRLCWSLDRRDRERLRDRPSPTTLSSRSVGCQWPCLCPEASSMYVKTSE